MKYRIYKKIISFFPDIHYCMIDFYVFNKIMPNVYSPEKFYEKVLWLKIYNDSCNGKKYADKYLVRGYIKEKIGEKYLIPLIGVYGAPKEFEYSSFDALPSKFVLKLNHGSGYNFIVKDKRCVSYDEVMRSVTKWYNEDYVRLTREKVYAGIKKKIIIEKFLESNDAIGLLDYKLYCFNGKPEYVQVIRKTSFGKDEISFYDYNWNLLPFTGLSYIGIIPPKISFDIPRPSNLQEMFAVAEALSENIPFLRVDLYNQENKIFFGEMTFYPLSGNGVFYPFSFNDEIGKKISL